MAKRFTKPTTNWVELAKRVPPDQKAQFIAFKTKSIDYWRRVVASPEEPPKIDWEAYRKSVPIPGLVDKFKEKYEAFQVPYPEDTLSQKIDDQWKALEPEIKKFCDEQQKQIEVSKKELAAVEALLPFEEMTMEDFAIMFPEHALDPINRPSFWPHLPEDQPVIGDSAPKPALKEKK